ncbi:MotA/TolQ/ExbB proton channel family protein [Verrucomicrobium spinosum]|uniref:MotA/TolQ/ExbB proton channel family protein n=1 Tax=Verrucomicrobium spinosum TaxID=2736 RepID=UPI0012F6D40A|nr:MotA/TolQ/ExbB proton channel family protein [Verrucomicrobium spinosum]
MKPAFTRMMTIGGLLILAGPLLGMLGSVMGITQSFEVLGGNGVGDPEQLSAAIAKSMVSTAVGMVFGFFGVALFLSGLIGGLVERKRLKSQSAGEVPAS